VLAAENEAKDIMSFTLAPTDGLPLPEYLGGQHITIRSGPKTSQLVRCYSLSSGANAQHYRISVKLARPESSTTGKMSGYLHECAIVPGFEVELMAPKGAFIISPEHGDPAFSICLIAGGIGITPMISMLYQLEKEHRTNPIELFYAVNSGTDHAFAREINELKTALAQFKVTTFYSMPSQADIDSKSFDLEGRMSIQHLINKLKDSSTHYYLCGPGGMISSMIQALEENGVHEGRIHMEAFGPSSKQGSNLKSSPQPITLLKSSKSLIWNPESSLLQLIEEAGITASSGCRVGQCESCSVKLVAGNVSYPDGINVPLGDACLICVAMPLTALTLDI
jgi:hypothetical protein